MLSYVAAKVGQLSNNDLVIFIISKPRSVAIGQNMCILLLHHEAFLMKLVFSALCAWH